MTGGVPPSRTTPITNLNGVLDRQWEVFFNFLARQATNGAQAVVYGTNADRLAINTDERPDGEAFVESDTGLVYQSRNGAWIYVAGTYRRTQSQLSALAATLGTNDAGLLVEVTDYRHVLRWTGSAWSWGPGEDGRHDFVDMPVAPDDLTGWQLCDGTTVAYLKGDGSTANFTTPNLTTGVYRKGGTYTGTINTASGSATLSGDTADESSHTHGISLTSAAPVGSTAVQSGAGTNVASITHQHGVTGTSNAGSAHHHSLSGASATLSGNLVDNIAVPVYFRR